MMISFRFAFLIFLSLFIKISYATVDPVGWSLNPSTGFPDVVPGQSSSVTYRLTVHPKFPGPVVLHTKFVQSSPNFNITDGCNNKTFNPGASCTVNITYVPSDISKATIQMSYQYNNNVIPLPALSASGSAQNQGIVGHISGLPATISLSPEQTPIFTVTYTNKSSADITGYAGNAAGGNLLAVSSTSIATVAVVSGSNLCGTANEPVVIKPGKSCTIQGQVTPISTGTVSVSGLFTYNNGAHTSNPSQDTTVVNSGSCLTGEATLPFQSPTLQYADDVIQYTFTNSCAAPTSTLGTVSFASSGSSSSPLITKGSLYTDLYDTCSGQTVAGNGGTCMVLVSVIPQNPGSLTVTASVDSVDASSSTTVNTPSYSHNVTFVNQCPFPVWYGVTAPGDPTPSPSPSAYLLPAQVKGAAPSTTTISFGSGTYNGVMLPRTGCQSQGSSFICATGDCNSGANGQCSNTAYEPFTRVEEIFPTSTTQGNYDVALENGPTVPAEFKGLGPSSNQYASNAASFVCSGAGAPIPIPFDNPPYLSGINLGYCPWTYTVPNTPSGSSPLYNFVTNTTTVTNCNSCSSPNVCGLAYQTTPETGNVVLACGDLLGYWTLNQLGHVTYVGSNPAYNPANVFQFNTLLVPPDFQAGYTPGSTAWDLYSCTPQAPGATAPLNTCYPSQSTPDSLCCGAQNWNMPGGYGSYLTAQSSNSDPLSGNPDWLSTANLPITPYESILWLKLACPTGYSYPYDDPSVSFNCNYKDAAQSEAVAMDFEVVFCPGGLSSDLSTNP